MADLVERVARFLARRAALKRNIMPERHLEYVVQDAWPEHADDARAIIPLIEADMKERCAEAVERERLADPQPDTSDEAYEQAITDAAAAVRSMRGTLGD